MAVEDVFYHLPTPQKQAYLYHKTIKEVDDQMRFKYERYRSLQDREKVISKELEKLESDYMQAHNSNDQQNAAIIAKKIETARIVRANYIREINTNYVEACCCGICIIERKGLKPTDLTPNYKSTFSLMDWASVERFLKEKNLIVDESTSSR